MVNNLNQYQLVICFVRWKAFTHSLNVLSTLRTGNLTKNSEFKK